MLGAQIVARGGASSRALSPPLPYKEIDPEMPARRPPPPPGISYDGRSPTSKYWGKRSKLVPMCPHLNVHGRKCGLAPDYCMCMCLLCGSPMRARRVCDAVLPDGSTCEWGRNRSPDLLSDGEAELSPERVPIPRPIPWYKSPAAPKAGPAPSLPRGLCLPNLEPGQPDPKHSPAIRKRRTTKAEVRRRWLDAQSLDLTPSSSPARGECGAGAGSCSSASHDLDKDSLCHDARHKVSATSFPSCSGPLQA
jgi:hypothetical protein